MKKLKVGLTGGIGSGKSLVCSMLEKMGFAVFNSDKTAKKLIHESTELKNKIIELIGPYAYDEFGKYNTSYVSQIVFENSHKLAALNELIHPFVRREFDVFVENTDARIVFNEAAILYETGAYKSFDQMVLVTAPLETRIKRCMLRDNLTKEAIERKIQNQWSDEKKCSFLPYEIKNDGILPLLIQIEELVSFLQSKKYTLETRQDIELLVETFYSKVMKDDVLVPFFKHLDFSVHLPKMVDFWCFVLIGTTGYTTNVIEKHLNMPLQKVHFDHWMNLFNETLEDLFEGENVELAKQRASIIAWTTKSKMNLN
jgi:dephospho-CoA kinase